MRLINLTQLSAIELDECRNKHPKHALIEKVQTLGLPTRKSEAYRYVEVEPLLRETYEYAEFAPKPIVYGEKIIIEDGYVTTAPKGIRVYYSDFDDVNMNHYDPLYFLGHLLSPKVIMIEIDGDSDIELLHRFTKSNTLISYRIVIKNQTNRHASIYEYFESKNAQNSLILYGYDIMVTQDSTLGIIKNQTINDNAYNMVASHNVKVGKQASMMLKTFDFGDSSALQLLNIELDTHAMVDTGHLLYLLGHAKRGTVSKIVHKGEHTHSTQEAKNILDDGARGIFDALIKVEQSAKYTKTRQNSKAILLGEGSFMVAKPQLEIYIDELEASHGSTTGQLNNNQLFYLQSRGISKIEARKMLIIAFANTLIETIRDGRQQEKIQKSFEEAFYKKDLS
ncbi:SufD family Fe-S cluster assembly protein [bacterium]|nr:SufD family Fe-S cluster assembly protein [bacterium]MBU1958577.1 SufD family Fe-S cluster assembly protein [bacterium]